MFTDNGDAVNAAALECVRSALDLFAKSIETMEPEKLLRLAEHQRNGARLAARVVAPGNGEPPAAQLGLWHAEAGWLDMCGFTIPAPTRH